MASYHVTVTYLQRNEKMWLNIIFSENIALYNKDQEIMFLLEQAYKI